MWWKQIKGSAPFIKSFEWCAFSVHCSRNIEISKKSKWMKSIYRIMVLNYLAIGLFDSIFNGFFTLFLSYIRYNSFGEQRPFNICISMTWKERGKKKRKFHRQTYSNRSSLVGLGAPVLIIIGNYNIWTLNMNHKCICGIWNMCVFIQILNFLSSKHTNHYRQ